MTAAIVWPDGAAAAANPTSGTYKWMLMTDAATGNFDATSIVSDLAAYEPTDGSYGRVTATGANLATDPFDPVNFSAEWDDPTFSALAGGDTIAWLVLYKQVTTDADHLPVVAFPVDWVSDGSDLTIESNSFGAVLTYTVTDVCTL